MCVENFEQVTNRATKSYKDEGRKHKTLFGSFFCIFHSLSQMKLSKGKWGASTLFSKVQQKFFVGTILSKHRIKLKNDEVVFKFRERAHGIERETRRKTYIQGFVKRRGTLFTS